MTIYDAASDQLWEFWEMRQNGNRWSACWGGRLDNASRGPGVFAGGFGATATGLPNSGGMVSLADVKAGGIDPALSLQVPNAARGVFSWPAQRSDGSDDSPFAMPEGTRLRLDARVDVHKLGLSPIGVMIAKAAQRYGFIVSDKSGAVAVVGEGVGAAPGSSQDPWPALTKMPDYEVLKGFPWASLQVLPGAYGR